MAPKKDDRKKSKRDSKRGSQIEEEEKEETLPPIDVKDMPVQDYLEESLVTLLEEGCRILGEKRPEDPVEHLASFLLYHDPKSPRNIIRFAEEAAAKELANAEAAAEEEAEGKSLRKKSSIKKNAKGKKK